MKDQDDTNRPSRQQLAIDRTHLANERTLLAYVRTALAMIGFGFLIMRFDTSHFALEYGLGAMSVAVTLLVIGVVRFYHFQKRIGSEKFFIEHEK